jgi:3-oxoacyl-[acyl-carrier protein] reductase
MVAAMPRPATAGRLADKRAVVTGASSGIGRAIAELFAREGAELVISYCRNLAGAEQALAAIDAAGRRAWAVQADVSQADQVHRLVDEAFARLGAVDVWVNNAGTDILTAQAAGLSETEKLQRALDVDLRGTVLCCWAAAERLKAQGWGVILNLSWDHALVGAPGRLAEIYAAAKGGILSFSKSLARSFAPQVRVNVLAPGWITTAFAEALPETRQRRIAESTPLRRWGAPEDVARAALFLASADAEFLTGATMLVNGGTVM